MRRREVLCSGRPWPSRPRGCAASIGMAGRGRYVKRRATVERLEDRRLLSAVAGAALVVTHHSSSAGISAALASGTIQGYLWNDRDADGAWAYPDTQLVGWTVYLDLDHNGALDGNDVTTTTNTAGHYQFTGLPSGTYTVRYVNQPGFHPAPNQPSSTDATIPDHGKSASSPVSDSVEVDFGLTTANGQITGVVNEVLSDGREAGAQNWGVYLDTNNNGRIDPGEPWTTTDASGHFAFTDLPFGQYRVRVDPLHLGWHSTSVAGQSYAILSDGEKASAPVTFAYQKDPPVGSFSKSQLVDYFLVGGSSADPNTRMVSRGTFGNGWWIFVTRNVIPDMFWGVKRVELHNPFGVLPGQPYFPADQYLEAQAQRLTWLTRDFVPTWRFVTRLGIEVIAYIGNPEDDPSFQPLTSDPAAWNARFDASVAPYVQAGMSIAFDVGQAVQQGDLLSQAIDRLRAQGITIYLEQRPPESSSYNLTFPVIAADQDWINSNPYLNTQFSWAAKNSEVPAANVVRIIQTTPSGIATNNRGWMLEELHSILEDGNSAAVSVAWLRSLQISFTQVLTPTVSANL